MLNSLFRKSLLVGLAVIAMSPLDAGAQSEPSPLEQLRQRMNESNEQQRSSALPGGGSQGAQARSPAMSLPTSDGQDIDPFAKETPTQIQSAEEIEAMIRREAMNAALTTLLPMEAGEIRRLLERFDDTQQAVEVPVYPYPKPEVIADTVSLDPGTKPPVIKVGVGHVTTLTILDVTGAPWPIQDLTYAGHFEVVTPEEGGHIIRITGMTEFGYGNLSIRLSELKTPVTFTLKTSRDSVHYRFDARIPEYGPFAEAPLIDGGLSLVAGNSILGSILDGLPPRGAEKLDVAGVDGRTTAYNYNEVTYVRTPLTLLSPGWTGSVSSADGMNVYAVANAPVLLLSDRGQVVRAQLTEGEPVHE